MSAVAEARTIAVLPIAAPAADKSVAARADVAAAARWFEHLSRGSWRARVDVLEPVTLPREFEFYAERRGMGRPPRNSQTLVADALERVPASERELIDESNLVLCAPPGMQPHTWRVLEGGFHLGARRWCRRYAIVPADASLGALAHELGHLLFDWPDFDARTRLDRHCLMALGGHASGGRDPAPPCAPLLVQQGWRELVRLDGHTPLAALDAAHVGDFEHEGARWLFEMRAQPAAAKLLVYRTSPRDLFDVRLEVERTPADADFSRPALALASTEIRG